MKTNIIKNLMWFILFLVPCCWFAGETVGARESVAFGAFCIALFALIYGRIERHRPLQIFGIVFFICASLMINQYKTPEPIGFKGADRLSNIGLGEAIGKEMNQNKFMLWNPYIFCGMPAEASLMATGLSQVEGMPATRKAMSVYWSVLAMVFVYWLFRFNPSNKELAVIRFFNDKDVQIAAVVLFLFGFPLLIKLIVSAWIVF
jgi:hypothetical protein